MRIFSLVFVVIIFFAASCRYQRPQNNHYLLNVSDTITKDSLAFVSPVIHKNDLLYIKVYSKAIGINPEADIAYNIPETGSGGVNSATSGFLVDPDGNIEYPQIGQLHIEGLTREQVADLIKSKLTGQLSQPAVIVRFLNYRVTVLGEVTTPGTFTLQNQHITILEVLGLAGDITEFGRKDNVKVIRENNGQREIGTIDLTSRNMFNSPYFRLDQNDVVLVEQTRRKIKQQDQQVVTQQIGIITSFVTIIALLLNFLK